MVYSFETRYKGGCDRPNSMILLSLRRRKRCSSYLAGTQWSDRTSLTGKRDSEVFNLDEATIEAIAQWLKVSGGKRSNDTPLFTAR